MRNMKVKFVCPVIELQETGRRLKTCRRLRGFTVADVSELLGGISVQVVYNWECGVAIPSIDNLVALSRLYKVNIDDLLAIYQGREMEYDKTERDQFIDLLLKTGLSPEKRLEMLNYYDFINFKEQHNKE